jgi:hypothetical protein
MASFVKIQSRPACGQHFSGAGTTACTPFLIPDDLLIPLHSDSAGRFFAEQASVRYMSIRKWRLARLALRHGRFERNRQ